MKTARQMAVEALVIVNSQGGYSNLVLDGFLNQNTSQRDSAAADWKFASALFYGVLERMLTLDKCIESFSKIKLEKLHPQVREILRTALYQLLYMDSVPESAAVNEAVKLTRIFQKSSASGYVNGVLRAFLRAGKPIPQGKTPLEDLSIASSLPPRLLSEWIAAYGQEAAKQTALSFLGPPPLYIRVNSQKNTPEELGQLLEKRGISLFSDPDLPYCAVLQGAGDLKRLPEFQEGRFHVQDKSSQICAAVLDPQQGERILDVCSAPGGKTFTIAQQMEDRGEIMAWDLHAHRVLLVEQGAERLGLSCIRAQQGDASRLQPEAGLFDRVLCDVPCSGFGVLGRKPEIRWKRPEELENLPEIQYKILETAVNYCREGGILVYSTCTLSPRENQQVIGRFLKAHPEFLPEAPTLPFLQRGEIEKDLGTVLLPFWLKTDGFYFCRMRRTAGSA